MDTPSDPHPSGGAEIDMFSDDDLLTEFDLLDSKRRAIDAQSAVVLAELDRRGVPERQSGHHTKAWVAIQADAPRGHAAREIRVAKLLAVCPHLLKALGDGQLSIHHVDAIARSTNSRNQEVVIAIQELLIDLTGTFTRFEPWERQVRDLLRIADQDGGHDPRPEDNHMSVSRGLDGELHLKATFVGQWAKTVSDTLDKLTNAEFRRYKNDNESSNGELEIPPRGSLTALAFAQACRNALSISGGKNGPVADVTLVIHSDDPTTATGSDGELVDSHTADIFRCDPVIHPVILNSLGVPTDLGRAVRLATTAQRRALSARDGGCVFPGCDAPPSWTDAHHVDYWEHGGRTDLQNLASLCRHHHGVVHRTGWSMNTTNDHWFAFSTPAGQVLQSQRHGATTATDRAC